MRITKRELGRLWTELDNRSYEAHRKGDMFAAKAFELLRRRVAAGGMSEDLDLNPHTTPDAAILEWAINAHDADITAEALYDGQHAAKMMRLCAMSKKEVARSENGKFVSIDAALYVCGSMIRRAHRVWHEAKIKARKLPRWAAEHSLGDEP